MIDSDCPVGAPSPLFKIVAKTINVAAIMVVEATLSFLKLDCLPDIPTGNEFCFCSAPKTILRLRHIGRYFRSEPSSLWFYRLVLPVTDCVAPLARGRRYKSNVLRDFAVLSIWEVEPVF